MCAHQVKDRHWDAVEALRRDSSVLCHDGRLSRCGRQLVMTHRHFAVDKVAPALLRRGSPPASRYRGEALSCFRSICVWLGGTLALRSPFPFRFVLLALTPAPSSV